MARGRGGAHAYNATRDRQLKSDNAPTLQGDKGPMRPADNVPTTFAAAPLQRGGRAPFAKQNAPYVDGQFAQAVVQQPGAECAEFYGNVNVNANNNNGWQNRRNGNVRPINMSSGGNPNANAPNANWTNPNPNARWPMNATPNPNWAVPRIRIRISQ